MSKKRLRPWVIIVMAILCLSGIIYYSYEVAIWFIHVDENQKLQKEIEKKITVLTHQGETEYKIDFKALKEQNPDTVGYIRVSNTNIHYIVVKGTDNDYYLKHNFEKKWNVAGWIFGDYHNHFDETDKNLIIYGHNTKDGSMFDTLIDTLKEEWYKNSDNYIITLVTEQGTYYYKVFSNYSIIPEDYYIQTEFKNDEVFDEFVNTLKKRSVYDYGVEVSGTDQILTLSSCIGEGKKRVVLHAKLIKEEVTENG